MRLKLEKSFVVRSTLSQGVSIGRADNGDILMAYANYPDCMAGETYWLSRSTDNGRTWSEPELELSSDMELGGLEGTLSCVPGLATLFYVEGSDMKRHPQNRKYLRMMRSTDSGKTWTEPRTLEGKWGPVHPYGQVIRLRDSARLLLPAYGMEKWLDRGGNGSGCVRILRSDDEGETWDLHGTIRAASTVEGIQCTETSLLELPAGRLMAISRGDAFKSGAYPYGLRSISDDGGETWSPAQTTNINLCEPRLVLTQDGRVLMAARGWPGNIETWYRPLEAHEREPGSQQTETTALREAPEYRSPNRDFGVVLSTTTDDGLTWTPLLTLDNPKGQAVDPSADLLTQHRYQAAYPDLLPLGGDRFLVVFRQPDPTMPDIRPGLTYSHVFQRFLAGNIVVVDTDASVKEE